MEVNAGMSTSIKSRINIAEDFSRYPAGRYQEDGDFNGTTFRKKVLAPALNNFNKVEVNFDGVAGFGSSFLEEAFGGLVKCEGFTGEQLDGKLTIKASESGLQDDVLLTKALIEDAL